MVKPTGVVHEALEGGDHPCVALCDARIQGSRLKGRGPEVFWGEGAGIEGNIELFRGAWSRQSPGLRGWSEKDCAGRSRCRVCPWFLLPTIAQVVPIPGSTLV